jgi:hypothetical protein
MKVYHLETTACHEETEAYTEEIQPDPTMMQSVLEHQEVPKEEAIVMPVEGLRKRSRDQNLAAGCRQKLKGRIQASCESQKRLTVAGRKVTRRARVAWQRENVVRKDQTRNQAERGTPKRRRETVKRTRMQQWHKGPRPETAAARQKWCEGRPLYLRKKRTTTDGIRGWSPGEQAVL